ncbi:MAG: Hpt domain-containing protein [Lachnospiraceae bacterium]|nr:Hpt domain-containing protein [Lachnospiraceae bacterium]
MQISDLSNYGFDVADAMELCINDEDIYKEVLETALEEGREKLVTFEEVYNAGDFDRYIIEAHGLKNAAKQIGATELSEIAKASELDGKAGNLDAVKARHEQLMSKYKEVLDAISQLF